MRNFFNHRDSILRKAGENFEINLCKKKIERLKADQFHNHRNRTCDWVMSVTRSVTVVVLQFLPSLSSFPEEIVLMLKIYLKG